MKNISAKLRLLKERFARLALIVLAIIGVGYISSVLTRTRCENCVAEWIASGPMKGQRFYIRWGDSDSWLIFRRVKADFGEYVSVPGPKGSQNVTWPEGRALPPIEQGGRRARVYRGHLAFPFIVSVDYEAFGASRGSETGTAHFLCIFGIPVKLVKAVHEQS